MAPTPASTSLGNTAATLPTGTPSTAASSSAAKTTTAKSGPTKKSTANTKSKTVTKAGATKAKKTTRKKKTTKTVSSVSTVGSSNNQIYAQSRAAQLDLAAQRSAAAVRISDPLWYQLEDYVLPAVQDESVMSGEISAKILPEQVQIVESALEKNGLTRADVTPQAYACLLEQARRYAIEILSDSQDYAFVANRIEISKADIVLANEFRPDHTVSVTAQLPKLNLLAQSINRIPLPPIPTNCYSGVLLPSKNYQLTARTYDVVTSAQTAHRMVQAIPTTAPPKATVVPNSNTNKGNTATSATGTTTSRRSSSTKKSSNSKNKPSYGARRGSSQISIKFKGDNKETSDGKNDKTKKNV